MNHQIEDANRSKQQLEKALAVEKDQKRKEELQFELERQERAQKMHALSNKIEEAEMSAKQAEIQRRDAAHAAEQKILDERRIRLQEEHEWDLEKMKQEMEMSRMSDHLLDVTRSAEEEKHAREMAEEARTREEARRKQEEEAYVSERLHHEKLREIQHSEMLKEKEAREQAEKEAKKLLKESEDAAAEGWALAAALDAAKAEAVHSAEEGLAKDQACIGLGLGLGLGGSRQGPGLYRPNLDSKS